MTAREHVGGQLPGPSRAWRFALVGFGGFAVQIMVLDALTRLAGLDYRAATVLALEAAILHNFVWHERWTWRVPDGSGGRLARAARFHTATALFSVVGNVVLMSLFVEWLAWPVLLANAVAVAILGGANFRAADGWVFRAPPRKAAYTREIVVGDSASRRGARKPVVLAASLLLVAAGPALAGPPGETVAAWDRYVTATERRIDGELEDGQHFLAMDFVTRRGPLDRHSLQDGNVRIEQVATGGADVGSIDVPGGMIHHWRGYVFIPGAKLTALMSSVSDPTGPRSIRQEDVLETRVLSRSSDGLRLFLKLQRRSLVSVTYNTEHLVQYRRHSDVRASSRSVATRIAEVDDVGLPSERERSPESDRGFLWRMNSYWRYQAVPGGVIVELESLTLSRSLPWGMRTVIRPLIEHVAQESIERTLVTLGQRIRRAALHV